MTNIASHIVAPPEPVPPSRSRSSQWLWLLAGGVAAIVVTLGIAPELIVLAALAVPAASLVALCVPQVHRLPALARILIYLAAAASFVWLAFIVLLVILMSGPNVHMG